MKIKAKDLLPGDVIDIAKARGKPRRHMLGHVEIDKANGRVCIEDFQDAARYLAGDDEVEVLARADLLAVDAERMAALLANTEALRQIANIVGVKVGDDLTDALRLANNMKATLVNIKWLAHDAGGDGIRLARIRTLISNLEAVTGELR